jgi:hypothetical protein
MASDFMRQFLAGWQMGQDRIANQRQQQMMAMRQEQEAYQRQQDQINNRLRMEEATLRKKAAQFDHDKAKFDMMAQQAATMPRYEQTAPPETMNLGGATPDAPSAGMLNLGPTVADRQMTAQLPGTDQQVPLLMREDVAALEQEELQRKNRAALGLEESLLKVREPYKISDDKRAADLAAQRDAAAEARYRARLEADQKKRKGSAATLRKEYNQQIKPYVDQIDQYNKARATAAIPDEQRTPADDISLVFLYMKSLDPGSTVREGEYATAKNAAGVPERVRNAYNATVKGTFLSPEQRRSFAGTIERNFNAGPGARVAEIQKRYDFLARDADIDPSLVLMDSGLAGDEDDGGGWETVAGVRVRKKARP